MEEKFYISKSYKLSILLLLIFASYGPLMVLINGHWSIDLLISLLFVLLLWFINLNFWINPIIIFSKDELIFKPTPYFKKRVSFIKIKSVFEIGSGGIGLNIMDGGQIKKQNLFPVEDHKRLIQLIENNIHHD